MKYISGLFIGIKYSLVVILYYSSQLFVWITIVGCLIYLGEGKVPSKFKFRDLAKGHPDVS